MRHTTYKHLEAHVRIGAFALGQWAQIAGAGVVAALFGGYLSPLPTQATIFMSILLAGLPVAVSYGAMGVEFSVCDFARAGWRFWRQPREFPAGVGASTSGYALVDDARQEHDPEMAARVAADGRLLWDS